MFVGVRPSVELFRYFFSIYRSPSTFAGQDAAPQPCTVGGFFFRWRGSSYPHTALWGEVGELGAVMAVHGSSQ